MDTMPVSFESRRVGCYPFNPTYADGVASLERHKNRARSPPLQKEDEIGNLTSGVPIDFLTSTIITEKCDVS